MPETLGPQTDPTFLTTAQLTREIANARELIETKVTGAVVMLEGRMTVADRHSDVAIRDVKEIIETRLLGMDKAIAILQGIQDRVPLLMDEKLNHLKGLHQEKFDSITIQFAERDTRTEQTAAGVKIADAISFLAAACFIVD
jgi:hypothetical protein